MSKVKKIGFLKRFLQMYHTNRQTEWQLKFRPSLILGTSWLFDKSESLSASISRLRVPEQPSCALEPETRTTLDTAIDWLCGHCSCLVLTFFQSCSNNHWYGNNFNSLGFLNCGAKGSWVTGMQGLLCKVSLTSNIVTYWAFSQESTVTFPNWHGSECQEQMGWGTWLTSEIKLTLPTWTQSDTSSQRSRRSVPPKQQTTD